MGEIKSAKGTQWDLTCSELKTTEKGKSYDILPDVLYQFQVWVFLLACLFVFSTRD
jgi:hypothetical protein